MLTYRCCCCCGCCCCSTARTAYAVQLRCSSMHRAAALRVQAVHDCTVRCVLYCVSMFIERQAPSAAAVARNCGPHSSRRFEYCSNGAISILCKKLGTTAAATAATAVLALQPVHALCVTATMQQHLHKLSATVSCCQFSNVKQHCNQSKCTTAAAHQRMAACSGDP
jgi:hypothetical protein